MILPSMVPLMQGADLITLHKTYSLYACQRYLSTLEGYIAHVLVIDQLVNN